MNIAYEYKIISMNGEINTLRAYTNRKDGDEVIALEILNRMGLDGWRAINPQEAVIYFERILDQAKLKSLNLSKAS